MNCFVHRSVAAVGICRACGKALCPACVAELKNGIACRDSCEERVELLNRIVDSNVRNVGVENKQLRSAAVLVLTLGVGMLASAVLAFDENAFLAVWLGAPGALFLMFGIMRLRAGGYPNPNSQPVDSPGRD
jgi:hypothetical protein